MSLSKKEKDEIEVLFAGAYVPGGEMPEIKSSTYMSQTTAVDNLASMDFNADAAQPQIYTTGDSVAEVVVPFSNDLFKVVAKEVKPKKSFRQGIFVTRFLA